MKDRKKMDRPVKCNEKGGQDQSNERDKLGLNGELDKPGRNDEPNVPVKDEEPDKPNLNDDPNDESDKPAAEVQNNMEAVQTKATTKLAESKQRVHSAPIRVVSTYEIIKEKMQLKAKENPDELLSKATTPLEEQFILGCRENGMSDSEIKEWLQEF